MAKNFSEILVDLSKLRAQADAMVAEWTKSESLSPQLTVQLDPKKGEVLIIQIVDEVTNKGPVKKHKIITLDVAQTKALLKFLAQNGV